MKIANLPRLRSLLKKLHAAPIAWNAPYVAATAGQEALDFIAMAAGMKPVYLTGRGFDEAGWRETVEAVARTGGFHVHAGPYWYAGPTDETLPAWFIAPARERLAAGRACYVAKTRRIACELAELAAGAPPSLAQEARLLGFPECCVAAHYAAAAALERIRFDLIRVRAGGKEAEMRRLAATGQPILPETDAERARMAEAVQIRPARHTSLNLCPACAADPQSPGQRVAAGYAALARALADRRAATGAGSGSAPSGTAGRPPTRRRRPPQQNRSM